jgi:iron complex outermembrane receptor protein
MPGPQCADPHQQFSNDRVEHRQSIGVDLGIENLFDKLYDPPLGGVDWADYKAEGQMGRIGAVPGEGRSFNAGVTMKF